MKNFKYICDNCRECFEEIIVTSQNHFVWNWNWSYTPSRIFYEIKKKFLFSWKVIQRNDEKYWSVLEKFCKMYKELFLTFTEKVLSELCKNVDEICCKQWRIFWENSQYIFNSFERKNSKKISEILVGKHWCMI